jgi:hypothetical protein
MPTGPALPADFHERSAEVAVAGGRMTLHLVSPRAAVSPALPLVVYASGDGGLFGAAVRMFHTIAADGYPTVGFSAKELLRLERRQFPPPLGTTHIANAYREIIEAARGALALPPDTPVVLTGWSRGASLGALAAGKIDPSSHVVGLVAIGLEAEEHLDLDADSDDDLDVDGVAARASHSASHARAIALYPLLSKLAPRRVIVLQATGDSYLPASRARALFGADTGTTRLVEVEARNHRFSGGVERFTAALVDALHWVASAANQ